MRKKTEGGVEEKPRRRQEGSCAEGRKGWRTRGPGRGAGAPLLRAGALFTLCYCLHLSLAVQC